LVAGFPASWPAQAGHHDIATANPGAGWYIRKPKVSGYTARRAGGRRRRTKAIPGFRSKTLICLRSRSLIVLGEITLEFE
jgi:hypothetical protein